MPRKIQRYGWKPDLPDHRDFMYSAPQAVMQALPAKLDMRPQCPPVYDQGMLGSCTANAIAGAFEFDLLKQKATDFTPSRLFIYYNERVLEHTVPSDSGAMLRDGVKTVQQQGVCPEDMWRYSDAVPGPFQERPTAACYTEALRHQVVSYQRVTRSLSGLRGCLASGFPFIFGFTVYESFETAAVAQTGVVPMPGSTEGVLGGHAVVAVGYDDASQRFIVRNSWGDKWGQSGYFTIPYLYLLDHGLASDFWMLSSVEQ